MKLPLMLIRTLVVGTSFAVALQPRRPDDSVQLSRLFQSDGGCSASSPCEQGCCGPHGWCGFGPDFCEAPGCQGTCDAVAECGQYALPENEFCALNICCSGDGFCGTTTLFCDAGCQNNCGTPSRPSCGVNSGLANLKTIGYYESWALNRPGCPWSPEDIDVGLLTHVNYAFALVGDDYKIAAMNDFDPGLYSRTVNLKSRNPSLRVSIAVGGWAASGPPFSRMAQTQATRAVFIQSVIDLLDTYGFDGIDLDWEYPVSEDRDGAPEDKENYVHLVKELRQALPREKEITVAIPASNWYLRHFDVERMAPHIDWFNIMTYDIHGTWDGNSKWSQAVVQPHTNLTEIDEGLDLLWRNNIDPGQVVLGLGFYGRSFTLQDPSCTDPMCPFSGGAEPGYCMATSGVLSNAEIRRIIDRTGVTPTLDREAGVKWISWEGQWVSYDDSETLALKTQFANNRCLAGKMIWAVDLDEPGSLALRSLAMAAAADGRNGGLGFGGLPGGMFAEMSIHGARRARRAIGSQNDIASHLLISQCGQGCPAGWHELTSASGVWAGAGKDIAECQVNRGPNHRITHGSGRGRRSLCAPDDFAITGCRWVGKPLFCSPPAMFRGFNPLFPLRHASGGGCPAGSVHLANNNMPPSGSDNPKECWPGTYAAFCCNNAEVRLERRRWCAETDPGSIRLGGGVAGFLSLAAGLVKFRQRINDLSGFPSPDDPFMGSDEFYSYDGCVINYNLEEFKALGWKPNNLPAEEIGDAMDVDVDDGPCTETVYMTWPGEITSTTTTRTCDVQSWPQACHNYVSVAKNYMALGHNKAAFTNQLLCPSLKPDSSRPWVAAWNTQHHSEWTSWIPGGQPACQRDEYPFKRFVGDPNPDAQWIRLLPSRENGRAGNALVRGVCPDEMDSETITEVHQGGSQTCFATVIEVKTQVVLSIVYEPWNNAWGNTAVYDDHLSLNPCLPILDIDDPGYALLTQDPWYLTGSGVGRNSARYALPPVASLTNGWIKPRDLGDGAQIFVSDDEGFGIVDHRNQSRRATPEELLEHLGVLPCQSPDCAAEKAALGLDVDGFPLRTVLEASTTVDSSPEATEDLTSPAKKDLSAPDMARITQTAGGESHSAHGTASP